MADHISNDDVKKMLEMLKEHAEATPEGSDTYATQTTKQGSLSDDDIKNMLKKHFSAEETESAESADDYSFDSEDFVSYEGEEDAIDEETVEEETLEETVEEVEAVESTPEPVAEEAVEATPEVTAEPTVEPEVEATEEAPAA